MSGSPYYIAPEVFLQNYNRKIDVWSMGVVLYIMLSGKVPFPGRTEQEIIYNVMKGDFHFNHPAFQQVSEECKDIIRNCLIKDFNKRYTAKDALAHKWIVSRSEQGLHQGQINEETDVRQNMKDIQHIIKKESQKSKDKRCVILYLSEKVNPYNLKGLYEALVSEDEEQSGVMTSEMFVRCLSKSQMKFTDREVEGLITDIGNEEKVNYKDFLKYSYLWKMH